MVHDLEAGFLTHGLQLRNNLTDIALFDELRCQVRIEYDGVGCVLLCHEAALLCDIDEKVILRECDLGITIYCEPKHALCVQCIHRLRAVHLGEISPN